MSNINKSEELLGKDLKKTDYRERQEILEENKENNQSENLIEKKIKNLSKTSQEYLDILFSDEIKDQNFRYYLSKEQELSSKELEVLSNSSNKDIIISITDRKDLNNKIIQNILNRLKNNESAIVSQSISNIINNYSKFLNQENIDYLLNKLNNNSKIYKKEIEKLNNINIENKNIENTPNF